MNKSFISNFLAFLLIIVGYFLDNNLLLMIGLFAFSGAITNAIAVHMLFEKVPFLYGSGVVESRFEDFKSAIHSLMMNEFFTKENLNKFFEDEISGDNSKFDLSIVLEKTDFTPAFDSLKEAVMNSSFGGMLGMFGGEQALDPLKEPFVEKLKGAIVNISKNETFQNALHQSLKNKDVTDDIYEKVSNIVNKRLDELTPKMVKHIVQNMIKEHLGWLVVWGAVFGGLIGFITTILVG
ncbi:DUF445 domain-containing protein [Malaciobacter molluscorum LMG 25693]|uniref:DUF445 domain-containing membrane protein n=1 Tax=Malaciobacter molluscorum LMG 25693 TaxID=870501 RepID=A0A2G1DGJ3_9BACT|nr:DUF445 domain-containing protein [Malaciobacter molluscorum]AXX91478.1 DUF445 domain-containing membrane protein [Malaciobacter molluscorum LMG 25693]PHO17564.1 DUF445 domain-containing protein [Malaciobacter molluscorum LMG 25693]RXJ93377.1 DUF445 domain-containing protein [Malaciobacter molluscorum]